MKIAPSLRFLLRLSAMACVIAPLQSQLVAQTATFLNAQSALGSGLSQPTGLTLDGAGDLFVVDNAGSQVVKIAAGTGTQTTIGSNLKNPTGVALNGNGDVFISDGGNNRVVVVPADGGPQFTVGASGLSTPLQVAVDSANNLYIVDNGNRQVVKIWANGTAPSTVATGLSDPQGVAVDGSGNVYISELTADEVLKVAPGGTQATIPLTFAPTQLSIDPFGNLLIAGNEVVDIVPAGSTTPAALVSGIGFAQGVALDAAERLFVSISGTASVEVLQSKAANFGKVEVCAAPTCARAVSLTYSVSSNTDISIVGPLSQGAANGEFSLGAGTTCGDNDGASTCTLVVSFAPKLPGLRLGAVQLYDYHGNLLSTVSLSGIGIAPLAGFLSSNSQQTLLGGLNQPTGVAVDGLGNRYITDTLNQRVLKLTPSGTQSTVQSGVSIPSGIAVDGAGDLLIGSVTGGDVVKVSGLNGVASEFVTGLSIPIGIAITAEGDAVVADSGNNRVVEFPANGGSPITLGSGFTSPDAVAVGNGGAIFVADTGNNRVVKLPPGGAQVVLGTGLKTPRGLAVDAAGDLLISDSGNNRVVTINSAGVQSNLTTAVKAPAGIAFDGSSHIYIADTGNNRVVELSLAPPSSVPFASTQVGTVSSDGAQQITVVNIGNGALNIEGASYPPDFPVYFPDSEDQQLCEDSTSLMASQSCLLAFEFLPLKGGALSEKLTITDNTLNAPSATQSIGLTGHGLLSQSIVFLLPASETFSPTAVNLASYAQATSGLAVSFKVVSGPAKLTGTSLTFTGAGTVVIQASQAGNANYVAAAPVSRMIKIAKATPAVTWAAPLPIVYGTKLGAAQLNASTTVAGKFAYTPAAGTVLAAGVQTLSTTFTPTNTAGYASVMKTVKITVTKAVLTVTANNASIKSGAAIPKFTAAYTGFVNGDKATVLTGAPTLSTTATAKSPVGSYAIVVKQGSLAAKNYSFKFVNGTLTITAASSVKPGGVTLPLPPREPRHPALLEK